MTTENTNTGTKMDKIPDDFIVSKIINGISTSADGRFLAKTQAGEIFIGEVPEDGNILVDGKLINCKESSRGVTISGNCSNVQVNSGDKITVFNTIIS